MASLLHWRGWFIIDNLNIGGDRIENAKMDLIHDLEHSETQQIPKGVANLHHLPKSCLALQKCKPLVDIFQKILCSRHILNSFEGAQFVYPGEAQCYVGKGYMAILPFTEQTVDGNRKVKPGSVIIYNSAEIDLSFFDENRGRQPWLGLFVSFCAKTEDTLNDSKRIEMFLKGRFRSYSGSKKNKKKETESLIQMRKELLRHHKGYHKYFIDGTGPCTEASTRNIQKIQEKCSRGSSRHEIELIILRRLKNLARGKLQEESHLATYSDEKLLKSWNRKYGSEPSEPYFLPNDLVSPADFLRRIKDQVFCLIELLYLTRINPQLCGQLCFGFKFLIAPFGCSTVLPEEVQKPLEKLVSLCPEPIPPEQYMTKIGEQILDGDTQIMHLDIYASLLKHGLFLFVPTAYRIQ